jgi:glucokinase
LLWSGSVPTRAERGPDGVAAVMVTAGLEAINAHGPVATVGVGVPGLFDRDLGTIRMFPNFPGPWVGYPLRDRLAEGLGRPVAFINDARAHTLAEARMGAGRGASTIAMLTLGTGIGGGLIIDGKLHLGATGTAGEIGHQTVDPEGPVCGCGNRGCAEALAQAGAMTRAAGVSTVEEVFAGVERGDPRCLAALDQAIDALSIAIGNVVTVLVPDRVVIGGGIAVAGDVIMTPLRAAVRTRTPFVPLTNELDLVLAELGPIAGAIGAALAGMEAE